MFYIYIIFYAHENDKYLLEPFLIVWNHLKVVPCNKILE